MGSHFFPQHVHKLDYHKSQISVDIMNVVSIFSELFSLTNKNRMKFSHSHWLINMFNLNCIEKLNWVRVHM